MIESYGPEHPTPDILEHIRRNVQAFYDAGGRIEIHNTARISPEVARDYQAESARFEKDFQDFSDRLRKSPNLRPGVLTELSAGKAHLSGQLHTLSHSMDRVEEPTENGVLRRNGIIIARDHEGRPSGALAVSWEETNPEIITRINSERTKKYQDDLVEYHQRLRKHELSRLNRFSDPWATDEDDSHDSWVRPFRPREPRLITPGGRNPWGSANIGTIKRVPGTGTALQHAYCAAILAPSNLGVTSSYASSARTFHKNVGRRVDWDPIERDQQWTGDSKPFGSSIWLPSDTLKIAQIPINNPNFRRISTTAPFPYREGDWNPDEVHPAWMTK